MTTLGNVVSSFGGSYNEQYQNDGSVRKTITTEDSNNKEIKIPYIKTNQSSGLLFDKLC